jgi:hypothetical protein
MKKADLKVGVEYAISGDQKKVPVEGIAGLKTGSFGAESFPMFAVMRFRLDAIDVPVQRTRGFRGEITETVPMIQVTWLPTGIEQLDRMNKGLDGEATRLGRFVFHADARFLLHARNVLGPWGEYAAERVKRLVEQRESRRESEAHDALRARVLARVEKLGGSAREGRGHYIEIEPLELERLLSTEVHEA